MSFKKFDLDKDTFNNFYSVIEGYQISRPVFSGTGGAIKNHKFPNHYFTNSQSGSYYVEVFDKPHSDISTNRLASISFGYTLSSSLYDAAGGGYQSEKLKMYRLFAKVLLGDENKRFIIDGRELHEAAFLCINRNQFKDNIIPKTTNLRFFNSGSPGSEISDEANILTDADSPVLTEFAGPYTQLYNQVHKRIDALCFLNAGIYVLNPEFSMTASQAGNEWSGSNDYSEVLKGSPPITYNDALFALKHRIHQIDYSGSSKTQCAFYRCTAAPGEFNYSSNPSFVSEDGEIITSLSKSIPTTYITQIALLGPNNEVLAVGKTYKPIKKDPTIGVRIVVRIDQ